jgi:hypothetical protein
MQAFQVRKGQEIVFIRCRTPSSQNSMIRVPFVVGLLLHMRNWSFSMLKWLAQGHRLVRRQHVNMCDASQYPRPPVWAFPAL